jgi:hypothetical protein
MGRNGELDDWWVGTRPEECSDEDLVKVKSLE